jgi:hypothetical protein
LAFRCLLLLQIIKEIPPTNARPAAARGRVSDARLLSAAKKNDLPPAPITIRNVLAVLDVPLMLLDTVATLLETAASSFCAGVYPMDIAVAAKELAAASGIPGPLAVIVAVGAAVTVAVTVAVIVAVTVAVAVVGATVTGLVSMMVNADVTVTLWAGTVTVETESVGVKLLLVVGRLSSSSSSLS